MPGSPNGVSRNEGALENDTRTLFRSIANNRSLDKILREANISSKRLNALLEVTRFITSSDDRAIDRLLASLEDAGFSSPTGRPDRLPARAKEAGPVEGSRIWKEEKDAQVSSGRQEEILAEIARDWSPAEIRSLGASLVRLADALDQDWNPEKAGLRFHWPSAAAQIERNSIALAGKAAILKRHNTTRKHFLPSELLGEPAWNMLLELFCQFAGGAMVSAKSLCVAADCPESTAFRYIDQLEKYGLLERSRSMADRRLTMIKLTKRGVINMGRVLERIPL